MTDEKWDALCERLEEQYPDLNRYREKLEGEHAGSQEVLEFLGPVGEMRVVRISKPVVTGVEHHYSHRQGDTAKDTYNYSETELMHKVHVYREVDGEWEEMSSSHLNISAI